MDSIWGPLLSGSFGAALIGAAVVIVKLLANRPIIRATAADQLSDSALDLVRQARDDAQAARGEAAQARHDADDARREAAEARREATDARREAMDATREMRRWQQAILSPYATLDSLRQMVGEPGTNGTIRLPKDIH